MNMCPFKNENTMCSLPGPETERNDGHMPTVAYCQQCSHVAFRCTCRHWNRAFARFCTQCGKKLEKPAVWEMASANPQRTATLPQTSVVDSLDIKYGFDPWVADTLEIEVGQDLPGLIAVDGFVVVPTPGRNKFDVCLIANPGDERYLKPQWSIEFNRPLTSGSTPIHHGGHLFSVMLGGIQKTNVFRGETEYIINVNGVDASEIEPIPGCAPLKCDVNGRPTLVAGLKYGMLLFDLDTSYGTYIKSEFFEEENRPMSPTLCSNRVVFTSQGGQIFSLDLGKNPYPSRHSSWENVSFSTAVTLGNLVYFETLNSTGSRKFASYDPISDELSKVTDLDVDDDLDRRRSLFLYPPLTDGVRAFLANRFGETVYTYHSHLNFTTHHRLTAENNHQPVFVPHRSIVVNSRIYSVHPAGLTVLSLDQNYAVSGGSLAMGRNDNPIPVAPPIRYGNNIFVLCNDRLLCLID